MSECPICSGRDYDEVPPRDGGAYCGRCGWVSESGELRELNANAMRYRWLRAAMLDPSSASFGLLFRLTHSVTDAAGFDAAMDTAMAAEDRITITESGLQALRDAKLNGEPKAGCIDHPDAPHGYDRNASHDAGEYRCLCDSWASGDGE